MPDYNELTIDGVPIYGATYALAQNGYTPQAAKPRVLYAAQSGINLGVAKTYDLVDESIDILVKGKTMDAVSAAIQILRRALEESWTLAPCVVSLRVRGQTNTAYTEIYSGHLQEQPEFIGTESGALVARVRGTWTRAPFWGKLGGGDTLINAGAFSIAGAAGSLPSNTASLGASGGDMTSEGSPLNITAASTSADAFRVLWLSTIDSVQRFSLNNGTVVTAGTAAQTLTMPGVSLDLAAFRTNPRLKLAVMARISAANGATAATNPCTFQAGLNFSGGIEGYAFSAIAPSTFATNSTTGMGSVFFGQIPLPDLTAMPSYSGSALSMRIQQMNVGTSGTTIMAGLEILAYYEACVIENIVDSQFTVNLASFMERGGVPALPIAPMAYYADSSSSLTTYTLRGTPPRYHPNALLWAQWVSTFGASITTRTSNANITVKHAPLYRTLRGNT